MGKISSSVHSPKCFKNVVFFNIYIFLLVLKRNNTYPGGNKILRNNVFSRVVQMKLFQCCFLLMTSIGSGTLCDGQQLVNQDGASIRVTLTGSSSGKIEIVGNL